MFSYPHKYEVVIYRTSGVTGRPLVPLTVHKGDDEDEARAVYVKRLENADKRNRVRLEVRKTIAETFPQIYGKPLDTEHPKG